MSMTWKSDMHLRTERRLESGHRSESYVYVRLAK
jgi:hypothetical protein